MWTISQVESSKYLSLSIFYSFIYKKSRENVCTVSKSFFTACQIDFTGTGITSWSILPGDERNRQRHPDGSQWKTSGRKIPVRFTFCVGDNSREIGTSVVRRCSYRWLDPRTYIADSKKNRIHRTLGVSCANLLNVARARLRESGFRDSVGANVAVRCR